MPFDTLKAVVDVAIEIGREGREGKAVGTLIVVGDARNVMLRTRQIGFDPFKGYKRKSATSATSAYVRRSRRSRSSMVLSWWPGTERSKPPVA